MKGLSKGRYDETFAGEDGDFQQCGILTSVDSGQPVMPPFKLRNSK